MKKCCGKHQIHGCLDTHKESELNNLFNSIDKRNESLASQYRDKLKTLTLTELQTIAEEIGIIPINNKELLIKNINKEFKNS